MDVELPEIFMALKFPKASTVANTIQSDELEACRCATMEYLLPRLQEKYPRLSWVELMFKEVEWGKGKPESKFQVYWKADVTMKFEATLEDKASQKEPVPRPGVLFERAGELFRKEHYLEFLREHQLVKGQSQLLSTAEEVQVGLTPQSTEGGAVKAPNFYMGFVCLPPPKQRPTQEQLERLRVYSLPKMLKRIKKAYPNSFDVNEGMTLTVIKSEINEGAGKPADVYNLYIEFEAVGIFLKDAPDPMHFYAHLASFELNEFLPGVVGMGGPLDNANQMAINPCAWMEELHQDADPFSLGDYVPIHVEFWLALVLPEVKGVPNEQPITVFDDMMKEFLRKTLVGAYGPHNFHSIDLQRSSCEFEAKVPLPRFNILHRYTADVNFGNPVPPPPHVLSKIMRCDVGTLIGLIATLPEPWDGTVEGTLGNAMFQKQSEEKFYEGKIEDKPKEPAAPAKAAPAPRMNLIKQWPPPPNKEAPPKPSPKVVEPPTPKEALPKPNVPPAPKKEVSPKPSPKISAPPAPKPEVPPKPSPKISAPPAPKKKVTPKPSPKVTAPPAPAPVPKVTPPKPVAQLPKPAAPAPSPPPVTNPPPKPAPKPTPQVAPEPDVKPPPPPAKESVQTVTPASAQPEPTPTDPNVSEHWADIFLALTIEDKPEPTREEYDKLAKVTQSFYTRFLSKRYGKDTFQSIQVSVRTTKYKSGIPEAKYNIYVEWDIKAYFNKTTGKAPHRVEFCSALASEIDMFVLLKDKVREIKNTPFENSVAIYTEQTTSLL